MLDKQKVKFLERKNKKLTEEIKELKEKHKAELEQLNTDLELTNRKLDSSKEKNEIYSFKQDDFQSIIEDLGKAKDVYSTQIENLNELRKSIEERRDAMIKEIEKIVK